MSRIYMDNAATTKVDPRVIEAMLPYFTQWYGNPSSVHEYGREAKKGLDWARDTIAGILNAQPSELVFTACGTESDNTALRGVAEANEKKGKHIITTAVEHHAVLHTCQYLEQHGWEVTYLPVDEYGMVTAQQVEDAIRDDTVMVSVMFANNEVGTIMPIAEIGAVCRSKGVIFHTDAVQAAGAVPIDVQAMNIDMLSISAHKFHGPKGIGAMYVKKGVKWKQFMLGGAQERGKRAGTENVPEIVGMATALQLAVEDMQGKSARISALRDKLIGGIMGSIPYTKLNGHPTRRLPNNVNISVKYIEGESMLLSLDLVGIAASSGSACTSGSLDPSHVLLAMGLDHETAHGSLRLTLSDETTEAEVDEVIEKLIPIVKRLRDMSPLYPADKQ